MKAGQRCVMFYANKTCKKEFSSLKIMDNALNDMLEEVFSDSDILSVYWFIEDDALSVTTWNGLYCARTTISYKKVDDIKEITNWKTRDVF